MAPEYPKNREVFGGKLEDLPKPWHRYFDSPEAGKREVKIEVTIYSGYCHYWCTYHLEENPIWDEKEKTWRKCWQDHEEYDSDKYPMDLDMRECDTPQEVLEWLDKVKTAFPTKQYKLIWGWDRRVGDLVRHLKALRVPDSGESNRGSDIATRKLESVF